MAKAKKKFPLPRVGGRKKSEDPSAGNSSRSNKASILSSAPSGDCGGVDSERGNGSRSLTPRGGFTRKPSFRFGRKKNKDASKSADALDDGDVGRLGAGEETPATSERTDDGDGSLNENEVDVDALPPALPTTANKARGVVDQQQQQEVAGRRPPPTPRSASNCSRSELQTIDGPARTSSTEKAASDPPQIVPRTRSLTPSDIHYHTAPSGGVNAPLTPITQHYASNQAMLDLFSTLYERDQFEVAYAVGVKFVEVALFQIPEHGYYKSDGAREERTKSAADAVRVTKMLGGMVDEMEDDDYDSSRGGGGVKRVERLNKLARVAQESFDSALDDELNSRKKRNEGSPSQMARIWNEYVMGEGSSEVGHNLCSLPDNICSFLSMGNRDNDVMNDYHSERGPVKKKSKIDAGSLPKQPEPIEIPQVFIKKGSAEYEEEKRAEYGIRKAGFGRLPSGITADRSTEEVAVSKERLMQKSYEEADIIEEARRKVSPIEEARRKTSPMDEARAEASTVASEEEEGPFDETKATVTQPMEVDAMTPKTRPSESTKKAAATVPEPRGESPPSVMTESEPRSPDEVQAEPVAVVKGRPVPQQQRQHQVDADGFNKDDLQLALSLSMSAEETRGDGVNVVSSSSEDAIEMERPHPGESAGIASLYREQYRSLRSRDKFHVRFLDTFQGRNPKSTNGCTVIAPLTCIQYFTSEDRNSVTSSSRNESLTWEDGVPDELINQVIDEHAATVLPEVREKLNLEGDAFIIPSDVHDHLIEVGLLSTSQFVGVSGGNILDDDHLMGFKNSLLLLDDERERERLKGRKIAATFFFHGHVIALHVIANANGDAWIELIDSLPNPETWIDVPSSNGSSSGVEERKTWSSEEDWERPEYDDEMIQNAIRVRCTDVEHFDTLLRHYACSKFSEEERRFVDETAWEDNSSYCEHSFDPRVFQAFIWAEAE